MCAQSCNNMHSHFHWYNYDLFNVSDTHTHTPEQTSAFVCCQLRFMSPSIAQQHLHALQLYKDSTSMRSEEHTSELQSLMRTSYAVFCLKNKQNTKLKY